MSVTATTVEKPCLCNGRAIYFRHVNFLFHTVWTMLLLMDAAREVECIAAMYLILASRQSTIDFTTRMLATMCSYCISCS